MQPFGVITTLATGMIRDVEPSGHLVATAYRKIATNAALWLNPEGIQGDFQADTMRHGGPDKAVLACGETTYARLHALGFSTLRPGALGENLVMGYWNEENVCIGDRFRIGETEVEVSQPRYPGNKINRLLHETSLSETLRAHHLGGWYFRVITEGYWQKGMVVKLTYRPHPEWSVVRVNDVVKNKRSDDVEKLLALPELATAWKEEFLS